MRARRAVRHLLPLLAPLLLAGCGDLTIGSREQALSWPAPAYCSVVVQGKGQKDVENDYLPHVVTCENGAAELEALKAQAVAARTFMYYKIAKAGFLVDGTSDQVYSCGSAPQQKHFDAVKATAGQVLVWSGVVICSFFVAGAKPSTADCVAAPSDPDPTFTEKFVTYNEGKSGGAIEQSTLGWVSPSNKENRGCFSQNGSRCLVQHGRSYVQMLHFYYGADIQLETAAGSCVTPPPPDQRVPDQGVPRDRPPTPRDQPTVPLETSVPPDLRPPWDGWKPPDRGPLADGEDEPWPPPTWVLRGGCRLASERESAPAPSLLLLALLGLLHRLHRRRRDLRGG